MKKIYKAERVGSLLVVRSCLEGIENKVYPKLLVDTGSTYTIISQELLELIGCSPATPKRKQRITTGSGYEIVPVVVVSRFHCLGKTMNNKEILAHTLPFGTYVDGLLGMDFLTSFKIEIKPYSG